jgi:hypothetical protein
MKAIRLCLLIGALMNTGTAKSSDEEQPKYAVVISENEFEIRAYETYYVVTTTYDLNKGESTGDGFKKLFNYISGENKSSQKIEMTAPVTTSDGASQKIEMTAPVTISENETKRKMSFMVPSRFGDTSIPAPTNPDVKIEKVEEQTRAVIKFSWFSGEDKKKEKTLKLIEWIKKKDYTIIGKPFYAGYDSPFTLPWLKTHEILVKIKPPKK